jgi:alpha-2-macroglobulin
VRVTLPVSLDKTTNVVMIQDNLPAGLEAVNSALNTSSRMPGDYAPEDNWWAWQSLGYNYKEIRGSHVSFFKTEASGQFTISYYARATHSGRYVAMPAEVSAMYDDTVWGRSDSALLTVN